MSCHQNTHYSIPADHTWPTPVRLQAKQIPRWCESVYITLSSPTWTRKKTFVCECCSLTTAQLLIPSCNPGLSWSSVSCASVLPWGRSQTVPQHWCPSWTCAQPLAVQPVHTWLHSFTHSFKIVIKFADYTTIISCITDGNESDYRAEVKVLALWCQDNNLLLNISKMKELIVDCRRQYGGWHASIHIEGTELL